jgi:hypothetical protein
MNNKKILLLTFIIEKLSVSKKIKDKARSSLHLIHLPVLSIKCTSFVYVLINSNYTRHL